MLKKNQRVYDNRISKDGTYPSSLPSVGDSPEYQHVSKLFKSDARQDSPMRVLDDSGQLEEALDSDDIRTSFAPPG